MSLVPESAGSSTTNSDVVDSASVPSTAVVADLRVLDQSHGNSSTVNGGYLINVQGGTLNMSAATQSQTTNSIQHPVFICRPAADTYARALIPHRHGYPLWNPSPYSNDLPHFFENGVDIGDVGVITADGEFVYWFNVQYPRDHERNRDCSLPENFRHVELKPHLIKARRQRFKPGETLKTQCYSTTQHEHVSTVPTLSDEIRFQSSSQEGALLYLPYGAQSQNTLEKGQLLQLAKDCAVDWYRHIYSISGEEDLNGSLYLVTGHDKTSSWANAAHYIGPTPEVVDLKLGFFQLSNSIELGCRWKTYNGAETNSGPEEGARHLNQTIFIRGFKILLRQDDDPTADSSLVVACKVHEYAKNIDSKQVMASPGRLPQSILVSASTSIPEPSGDTDHQRANASSIKIESIPDRSQFRLYHPSDILNRYLLERAPEADVAITHDEDWCEALASSCIDTEEEGSRLNELMIETLFENHDNVEVDQGIAYFNPGPGPYYISESESEPSSGGASPAQPMDLRTDLDTIKFHFETRNEPIRPVNYSVNYRASPIPLGTMSELLLGSSPGVFDWPNPAASDGFATSNLFRDGPRNLSLGEEEVAVLKKFWAQSKNPTPHQMVQLAAWLQRDVDVVERWFREQQMQDDPNSEPLGPIMEQKEFLFDSQVRDAERVPPIVQMGSGRTIPLPHSGSKEPSDRERDPTRTKLATISRPPK